MLFKTVYGPELQSITEFIAKKSPVNKEKLYHTFIPLVSGERGNTTNLDDALSFLTSCHMIKRNNNGTYESNITTSPFHIQFLASLRRIQQDQTCRMHPNDGWFFEIIDHLFIHPDEVIHFGLHKKINSLLASEPFSEEKFNAWKRVLEFAGVGRRVYSGFLCTYHPDRVIEIIENWTEFEGPLQVFLEEHFNKFLPWQTKNGEMSRSLSIPLNHLHSQNIIRLSIKQDLPHRLYSGMQKSNWITKGDLSCYHV